MPGKCGFNPEWTQKEQYRPWLEPLKGDRTKARCTLCPKVFDIASMGESALRSHMKGEKHKSLAANSTCSNGFAISNFFHTNRQPVSKVSSASDVRAPDSGSTSDDASAFTVPPPPQPSSSSAARLPVARNDVLKAEVLWTLYTVVNRQSYKSCETASKLVHLMFPDSTIASKFSCGERKTSYLCVFGIAEHIKLELRRAIKDNGLPYVILFDESLNKKSQLKQMDIHIRYWENNKVCTRYLDSKFLGNVLF